MSGNFVCVVLGHLWTETSNWNFETQTLEYRRVCRRCGERSKHL